MKFGLTSYAAFIGCLSTCQVLLAQSCPPPGTGLLSGSLNACTFTFVDQDVVIDGVTISGLGPNQSRTFRVIVYNGSITVQGNGISGAGVNGADGLAATNTANATSGDGGGAGYNVVLETWPSAATTPPPFQGAQQITVTAPIDVHGGSGGNGGSGYGIFNYDECDLFARAGQGGGAGGTGGNVTITTSGPLIFSGLAVTSGGNGGNGGNGGANYVGQAQPGGAAGAAGNAGNITLQHTTVAKNHRIEVSASQTARLVAIGGFGGAGGGGAAGIGAPQNAYPGTGGGRGGTIRVISRQVDCGASIFAMGGNGGSGGKFEFHSGGGWLPRVMNCTNCIVLPAAEPVQGGLGGTGGLGGSIRVSQSASGTQTGSIVLGSIELKTDGGDGYSAGGTGLGINYTFVQDCQDVPDEGCADNVQVPAPGVVNSGSGGAAGTLNVLAGALTVSGTVFSARGGNGGSGTSASEAGICNGCGTAPGAQGGAGGGGGSGGAINMNFTSASGTYTALPCGGNGADGGTGGAGNPAGFGGIGGGAGLNGTFRINNVVTATTCTPTAGTSGSLGIQLCQ